MRPVFARRLEAGDEHHVLDVALAAAPGEVVGGEAAALHDGPDRVEARQPLLGRRYSSNATCLTRPHLCYVFSVDQGSP